MNWPRTVLQDCDQAIAAYFFRDLIAEFLHFVRKASCCSYFHERKFGIRMNVLIKRYKILARDI